MQKSRRFSSRQIITQYGVTQSITPIGLFPGGGYSPRQSGAPCLPPRAEHARRMPRSGWCKSIPFLCLSRRQVSAPAVPGKRTQALTLDPHVSSGHERSLWHLYVINHKQNTERKTPETLNLCGFLSRTCQAILDIKGKAILDTSLTSLSTSCQAIFDTSLTSLSTLTLCILSRIIYNDVKSIGHDRFYILTVEEKIWELL